MIVRANEIALRDLFENQFTAATGHHRNFKELDRARTVVPFHRLSRKDATVIASEVFVVVGLATRSAADLETVAAIEMVELE